MHLVRGGPDVGVAAVGLDAVEQARVAGGDDVLLDRSARAPVADRVAHLAVPFDDVLLHHHHRFRGDDLVAVLAEDVERGRDDGEAFRQRRVVEDVGHAALEVVGLAVAAERPHQLAVPAALRGPRLPRLARIEHDGFFEFPNAAPGEYVLRVRKSARNPHSEGDFASQFISVTGPDITGLVVRASSGSTIVGHVTLEGAGAPPRDAIEFVPTAFDPDVSPYGLGGFARAEIENDEPKRGTRAYESSSSCVKANSSTTGIEARGSPDKSNSAAPWSTSSSSSKRPRRPPPRP